MSGAPVVPPAPPERRALGRAALVAAVTTVVAGLASMGPLSPILAPGPGRAQALEALGLPTFRALWYLWLPCSASWLLLAHAWSRACRARGITGAGPWLVALAAALDLGAQAHFAVQLPFALRRGPEAVAQVDAALWEVLCLPAVLLYAAGFALLAARSARRRCLPPALLAGLGPFFLASALVASATLLGRHAWVQAATGPYFLVSVAWFLALAWWCLGPAVRAR